jgi:hypothetical protein
MEQYLNYFSGGKIFYFDQSEYSLFDPFKFFPYKKYYYLVITFVPMSFTKHATVYFELKSSDKFLNSKYDIRMLEDIYKSEFLNPYIQYFDGEFIFSKSVDTGTPFSENSSIGVPLNLFFYRKKVVRDWVQMMVDVEHCNVQEIKIKQSRENQWDMNTVIESDSVNEFTGKEW